MKLLNKWMIALALPLLATACYDEVDPAIPHVDSPVLVSTTPENGATSVGRGDITISVTYDKNVFFATSNIDQLQFTGGTLESADVLGSSNTLTVNVNVPTRDTQCTLTIPEGVVTGPNDMPAPEVTVQFSTVSLAESLADAAAIPEAVSLYNYLLENFETATLSATMADVAWNTDNADKVFQWTGEYPAINCFDYMHLNSSPTDWINYNDITPVKDWSDKGGIVAAMWHWNVPTSDPNAESEAVTLYDTETTMPSGWGGSVQIPATDLAGARVGSQIIVNITDVTSGAQGSFKDGSTWLGLVDENGTSYEYFDISGESFSITLDATTLEANKFWSNVSSKLAVKRMQRFNTILERLISPEGTFPPVGRSITYRMGVFQTMALAAWKYGMPENISNGQVRAALTKVMQNMFAVEGNFNEKGFLALGFAGHQPDLANYYTNNGSLYMTSLVYLPLGLPADHPFWTDPAEPWTSQKAWTGKDFPIDGHVSLKK